MSTTMKTKPNNVLGHFEHLVVTAIASLTSEDSEAFGLAIRDVVEELYGGETEVNLGSIYATLERLEDKGYAESWESEPMSQRGGRSRICYRLLPTRIRALEQSTAVQKQSQSKLEAFWRASKWQLRQKSGKKMIPNPIK